MQPIWTLASRPSSAWSASFALRPVVLEGSPFDLVVLGASGGDLGSLLREFRSSPLYAMAILSWPFVSVCCFGRKRR